MTRMSHKSLVVSVAFTLLLVLLAVSPWPSSAIGDDEAPAKPKPTVRLPAHYSKIVTDEQRKQIYAIHLEYAERIDALQKELARLQEERDARTRAVLTPAQQQTLDELIAANEKAKRVQAAAAEGETGTDAAPGQSTGGGR